MNDDELTQRLRQALHDQAEGLQPTPGRLPSPDLLLPLRLDGRPGPGSGMDAAVPAGAADPLGPVDGESRRGTNGERQTAEYALTPPTGPVPIFGRGAGRRRWPPLVGVGAVAAAAAAAALGLALSGGHRPVTVRPESPASSSATTPATSPPPSLVPTTVAPPPPPPATVPRAAAAAVPTGFQPLSVTFVSPSDGWAAGWAPGARSCVTVARTTDGGHTWAQTNTPYLYLSGPCPGTASGTPPFVAMRFADREDGWIYTRPDTAAVPSQLWSTHDGGATWTADQIPMVGATIGEIEASGGYVQMVASGPCSAGSPGCQGQTVEEGIFTSGVGADHWVPSFVQPAVGAGPALTPQLTLWAGGGWVVNTNRTVASGAQLSGGTQWADWTPPCSTAHGAGLLAAASATDLVALCSEGTWGTPDPGTTPGNMLFRSEDGGTTFNPVGPLPGDQPQSITVAPGSGQTIIVADSQQGLLGSFNGGQSWATLEPGLSTGTAAASGNAFGYVGFTTATQGVAISYQPTPTLYMTRDGGHSWIAVSF